MRPVFRDRDELASASDLGEPHAGGSQECFPPALRELEPIAADARTHADGRALAGMALTSGLAWAASVARDDAQRRQAQTEDLIEFCSPISRSG